MKTRIDFALILSLVLPVGCATVAMAQQAPTGPGDLPHRPQGSCDIYAAAGAPCVAAHSTTRALYATYNGPLYQILRQSDGKTLDIGVVQPAASPVPDTGGYADAPAQDRFCAGTYCWISVIYDQSPKHNDLTQAPRGGFSGPALGGFNNLPIADMAPISIMGHKVYGVFIEPGMGLRQNDVKGTAVDDQGEGQYWVVNGKHYNSGCCFDYGNAEIDSRDDDNGTMETLYFGSATPWFSGAGDGPWIMTDQENNLVGCVNEDGTKGCPNLPSIHWRFVTAMGKGEPHHWTSLGGDAQKGPLSVMFDGKRVNPTYDPMRKQGAILLGNGGDNSVGSQGTFYEGAMTAAGTFPSDATDQLVQANVVAAGYGVTPITVLPATTGSTRGVVQTFTPESSRDFTVTFTNTTGAPVAGVTLSTEVPGSQWTSVVAGATETSKTFAQQIAPGGSVSATFKVTSGPVASSGDLAGKASWANPASGRKQVETAVNKVRNALPVKINEFRVTSGDPANPTNSFIELYNAGSESADISNWTLTERPARQAIFSSIKIPAGTKLAPGGFYLLGLSNSGLAAPVRKGDSTLYVRNTDGMSRGDTISIGAGSSMETRTIASLGTAATNHTTLWQPLPEGPVITIPAGSTNVPVENTSGFVAGQKIALGHGSTYPAVANTVEQYEIATVTAVGNAGTQAWLAMDAPAGATNLKVTSLSDISVGDNIRLDVDTEGHGIETVTVAHVGTAATKTNLSAPASAGAARISVRQARGFAAGDRITVGTPASQEAVTITAVGSQELEGAAIDITPALVKSHVDSEWVVSPGTGLDLTAPLRFHHAANLPFSDRGTGISFQPATAFAHASNEPVQALGAGIALDKPLANDHGIHTAVRDASVKTAGYQGIPEPNQWFGGPEFTTKAPQFGRSITVEEGSMVLRDASGVVADSLNYGGLVDPWTAEGDQAASGARLSGCYVPAPGSTFDPWSTIVTPVATNTSAGRFPDGADTDSNCTDFLTQAVATLSTTSPAGATNIKVTSMEGFRPGQAILMDSGANRENAVISTVGTAGATTLGVSTGVGATVLPAANVIGFSKGQTISIGEGANSETAVVSSIRSRGVATITLAAPLAHAHAAGEQISGSGIGLTTPLSRIHSSGAQVSDYVPTPGAPNQYQAAATTARPAPAPLQVPNPHYVTLLLTQDVNAPADAVWARVGKFCDIGEWAFPSCKLIQGDGGFASERTIVNEVLVGKTEHSYTYTQPVRKEGKYNLYHGTMEVQPVTARTSRLVYTFLYDNSLLADDAARNAEMATRKERFNALLVNMKTLAEGGKLPVSAILPMPPTPTPEQLQTANPHYVAIPMTLIVNAPVDTVWARIGKYCDIGEWGFPNCTILSGDGGLGTVRSIGNEVLVGKTKYSYTYTQPVREGVTYNMYHGTLEAEPLSAATTRLNYTLVYDNSNLADDAAREKDLANRRTRFTGMLENMKILCEGGTLPPGALGGGGAATPARPR